MRRIFIHLHIPKCGGSTITEFLSRNFGSNLSSTNSILNDYQYDATQVARIIDQRPNLQCLTGHKLSLDLPFSRQGLDIQAFTWVRDPIDRFVSHYFYHRNHTTLIPQAKTMDLLEYAEWALKFQNQKLYINGQVRFLSGGSMKTIRSMVEDRKLLLFPLSKLQKSIYTLSDLFPETFSDVRVTSTNVSKKDQALPNGFREFMQPYIEEDLSLLELANQVSLKNEMSNQHRSNSQRYKHIRRKASFNTSQFLHRLARFIE